MKPVILESEKDKLVLKFEPFDQGTLNLVKQKLWEDSATTMAGFKVTHPEVGFAKFVLNTKAKAPKTVWNSAIKAAADDIDSFSKEVKGLK